MSTIRKRVYGYLAEFESASALYKAAEKVRDAGFRRWDCYSPFPVHGLDGAMGMKRSVLPWFVFFGGAAGLATAFLLAYEFFSGVFYSLHLFRSWIPCRPLPLTVRFMVLLISTRDRVKPLEPFRWGYLSVT